MTCSRHAGQSHGSACTGEESPTTSRTARIQPSRTRPGSIASPSSVLIPVFSRFVSWSCSAGPVHVMGAVLWGCQTRPQAAREVREACPWFSDGPQKKTGRAFPPSSPTTRSGWIPIPSMIAAIHHRFQGLADRIPGGTRGGAPLLALELLSDSESYAYDSGQVQDMEQATNRPHPRASRDGDRGPGEGSAKQERLDDPAWRSVLPIRLRGHAGHPIRNDWRPLAARMVVSSLATDSTHQK